MITLYRKYISPIKPACCRFTPSCSAYAIEALEKRGLIMGLLLTIWRILRCNPFCRGGYDPVPERGFRNPKPKAEESVEDDPETTDEKEIENV